MRSIFTLAGLLVTVGVIMWAFSKTAIPVAHQGQAGQKEAEQLSGRASDGTPVAQTFTLEAQSPNGKLKSLLVTSIVPGSPMETWYGLKKDDQITEIGPVTVEGYNNDGDLAISMAQQAYQQKQPLVVVRDGKELTLAGNADATPSGPTPANPQQPNGIQIPGQ